MQIEKMSAALRPRNHWEAVDLGFRMAQRWYLPLFILWLIPAVPVFIICHLIPQLGVIWAAIIIWWLKPVYEQCQLFYISRALFGEYLSIHSVIQQYWNITKVSLLQSLTIRRLSLARSFNNPVTLLEGLKGSSRSERLRILHFTSRNASQWLHIFLFMFEGIFWLGLCLLFLLLQPEEFQIVSFDELMSYEDFTGALISNVFYFIAMAAMAPFYVCAGFSLYLTRRTELEGWDIELAFRKIAERLSQLQAVVTSFILTGCLSLLVILPVQQGWAMSREQASDSIAEVLNDEAFGETVIEKKWVAITEKKKDEEKKNFFDFEWLAEFLKDLAAWLDQLIPSLASILEFILWTAVIILILFLVRHFTHWLDWISLPEKSKRKRTAPPTHLFGLEVSSESLPDNIPETVKKLLTQGNVREAVSLLYRASLVHLIHSHQLDIADSATEGECRDIVEAKRPVSESGFFSELTNVWLLLAYAHEPPLENKVQQLCTSWSEHYGAGHE